MVAGSGAWSAPLLLLAYVSLATNTLKWSLASYTLALFTKLPARHGDGVPRLPLPGGLQQVLELHGAPHAAGGGDRRPPSTAKKAWSRRTRSRNRVNAQARPPGTRSCNLKVDCTGTVVHHRCRSANACHPLRTDRPRGCAESGLRHHPAAERKGEPGEVTL